MWSIGPAEGPPRVIPAFPFYDELSAHAAFCIMVALRERPQAGGQVIDLCLHDLLAYRESTAVSYYTIAGRSITSRQRGAAMPPTGIWDVSDGQVELLIWNPPHWDGFLEIVAGRRTCSTRPCVSVSSGSPAPRSSPRGSGSCSRRSPGKDSGTSPSSTACRARR